jgi:hypothetical protein
MNILVIGVAGLLLSFAAGAAEPGAAARAVIAKAGNDCKFEQGKFQMQPSALSQHDLNGDGKPDEIVDTAKFSCSTAASLWGGSGGTYLYAVVNGKSTEFLAHSWRLVDVGRQKVLLLSVHHSECGGATGSCFRAYVWSNGEFRTTKP